MSNGSVPPFVNLQTGFYNAISQLLGFQPGSPFQLLQPSTAITSDQSNADQTLWNYLNSMPPYSLTQSYVASSGNLFFTDYSAVIGALIPSVKITFRADIGSDCYADWLSYVRAMKPAPAANQLSTLFLNWASIYYPDVANKGARDLAAIVLDPVSAAQTMLTWSYPAGSLPDWSQTYDDLVSQLAKGQAITNASLNSSSFDYSTSTTWSQQSTSGLFGLWGGSSYSSSTATAFAQGDVSMTLNIDHVTTFSPAPGLWYNSAALGLAYAAGEGNAPWDPTNALDWNKTFGPDGNMQRFASSLVVVSGLTITVTSSTVMTDTQAAEVINNSGAGLWPFYSSNSSSGSNSYAVQNANGTLTLTITTPDNVPTVIGVNVLPAGQFLGHQSEALARFAVGYENKRSFADAHHAHQAHRGPLAPRSTHAA
jgi:hypothetical protein